MVPKNHAFTINNGTEYKTGAYVALYNLDNMVNWGDGYVKKNVFEHQVPKLSEIKNSGTPLPLMLQEIRSQANPNTDMMVVVFVVWLHN